jgi:hypothetical protein
MSSVAAFLGLALALAPQDGRKLTAEPDRRVEIDLQHFYPPGRLAVTWSALATAYPELVRVEMLGTSRGEQELVLVTLARFESGDPKDRPALLVVGGLGPQDLFAPELALATVTQMLQDNARDAAVSQVLDRCALYFVPCLDPDLRGRAFAELEGAAEVPAARPVALDRNFPALWDPLTVAESGPYPLSEPETKALTEFLVARPNVAAVLRFHHGAPPTCDASSWPRSDVEAHALDGTLVGLESIDARGGGLLAFAYLQQGTFVFTRPVTFGGDGPWQLPPVLEIQTHGRGALGSTLRIAHALPRLALAVTSVEPLGSDQWAIEVEVANEGQLPTSTELGRERRASEPPRVAIGSGKLAAAALVSASGTAEPIPSRGNEVDLPEIPGGASVRVRLFLTAPSAAALAIDAFAPRAGRAAASAALPH